LTLLLLSRLTHANRPQSTLVCLLTQIQTPQPSLWLVFDLKSSQIIVGDGNGMAMVDLVHAQCLGVDREGRITSVISKDNRGIIPNLINLTLSLDDRFVKRDYSRYILRFTLIQPQVRSNRPA